MTCSHSRLVSTHLARWTIEVFSGEDSAVRKLAWVMIPPRGVPVVSTLRIWLPVTPVRP